MHTTALHSLDSAGGGITIKCQRKCRRQRQTKAAVCSRQLLPLPAQHQRQQCCCALDVFSQCALQPRRSQRSLNLMHCTAQPACAICVATAAAAAAALRSMLLLLLLLLLKALLASRIEQLCIVSCGSYRRLCYCQLRPAAADDACKAIGQLCKLCWRKRCLYRCTCLQASG